MVKRRSQGLIEIVFTFPLVLFCLFGILEYGLYYRSVCVVQDMANEAAIVACRTNVVDTQVSTDITDTDPVTGYNAAVLAARDTVWRRLPQLELSHTIASAHSPDYDIGWGARPYSMYEVFSPLYRPGDTIPIVVLSVDYRNVPVEGVIVQVSFQYRTLLMGVSLPLLGSKPIVLIPKIVPISSTQVRQYPGYF